MTSLPHGLPAVQTPQEVRTHNEVGLGFKLVPMGVAACPQPHALGQRTPMGAAAHTHHAVLAETTDGCLKIGSATQARPLPIQRLLRTFGSVRGEGELAHQVSTRSILCACRDAVDDILSAIIAPAALWLASHLVQKASVDHVLTAFI